MQKLFAISVSPQYLIIYFEAEFGTRGIGMLVVKKGRGHSSPGQAYDPARS